MRVVGRIPHGPGIGAALIDIRSPTELSHREKHLSATLKFLKALRLAAGEANDVRLDLSGCEEISPAGCLMLAAEINSYQSTSGRRAEIIWPERQEVSERLAQFGFRQDAPFEPKHRLTDDHRFVLYFEDNRPRKPADAITEVASVADAAFESPHFPEWASTAIREAVQNVGHHAFDREFNADTKNLRWWMSSVRHAEDEGVSYLVLDNGPGIPTVAPAKRAKVLEDYWAANPEQCTSPPNARSDRDILIAAAEARRSGIAKGKHCCGMEAMIRLIAERAASGSIRVISGRAVYYLARAQDGPELAGVGECAELEEEFPGTLIVWRVREPRDLGGESGAQ